MHSKKLIQIIFTTSFIFSQNFFQSSLSSFGLLDKGFFSSACIEFVTSAKTIQGALQSLNKSY